MRVLLRLAAPALTALLAACSGGTSAPDASVGGTTMRSIEGNPAGVAPLRPEPGDIWGDGLLAPVAPGR
ncbi:hypothetical protein E0493_21735 [Roseomonas sp. M0104]|uniref:Uncharacterized protein n=1 Tax=Teichococcus coralli TaxID=2545983 RepID=A0A845BEH3_9PROT|nr:hypothetical protein [Pseudoroseomonas coralli]MXP65973.1 hypothetical protein [Pseudoroseomonas coralli]